MNRRDKRDALEELVEASSPFRDAFTYDPGHSDLDDEQPITITVTLGDWRRLDLALPQSEPQLGEPSHDLDRAERSAAAGGESK